MTLGQLIAQQRAAAGVTLQQLADACGTSRGHICDIEHDRYSDITLRLALAISTSLGVPLGVLAATASGRDARAARRSA